MGRLSLLGLAVVATVSCATKPIAQTDAHPVPSERVFAFQQVSEGATRLVVIRDKGFAGKACAFAFYFNGQLAAELRAGEYVELNVPAGNAIIGIAPSGGGLCGSTEAQRRETPMVVLEDGRSKVRISLSPYSGIHVAPTAF